jgi:hypothetical protein
MTASVSFCSSYFVCVVTVYWVVVKYPFGHRTAFWDSRSFRMLSSGTYW